MSSSQKDATTSLPVWLNTAQVICKDRLFVNFCGQNFCTGCGCDMDANRRSNSLTNWSLPADIMKWSSTGLAWTEKIPTGLSFSSFCTKSFVGLSALTSMSKMRPSSPPEINWCGRSANKANLWLARLCCATFLVRWQVPVSDNWARRTWPSRLDVTMCESPVNGRNFDWKTFEVCPVGKEQIFWPLIQSQTMTSRSSLPEDNLDPDSLKWLKSVHSVSKSPKKSHFSTLRAKRT